MDDFHIVQLIAYPLDVQSRASAHVDALQREFDLIRSQSDEPNSVPHRLLDLIDELTRSYGGVGDRPREEIEAARTRGETAIDVVYEFPAEVADACRRLDQLLDETDDYCRRGTHLLTLAATPESLAFRKWFLGDIVRQIDGQAPVPWPDFAWHEAMAPGAEPTAPDRNTDELPAGWSVQVDGDHATVTIDQELDLESSPTLRTVVQDLTGTGLSAVTLDLSKVQFIDSVALSVLIAARRRFDDDGTTMRIVPSPPVRRTLEVSGVLDWLGAED